MSIDIANESSVDIDEKDLVDQAAFMLRRLHINPAAELSIMLVDEVVMSNLHEEYMDEPGPTDVLSFPMDELRPLNPGEQSQAGILGDLVFSPDYILRQSQNQNVLFEEELDLLVVHGVLHCLGFDHQEEIEHKEMFDLQREILEALAEYRQGGPIE